MNFTLCYPSQTPEMNFMFLMLCGGLLLTPTLSGLGMSSGGVSVRPCSNAGKLMLREYCMKPESRVAGPWADKPLYRLKYYARDLECMENPLPLQKEIIDIIEGPPDDRRISWYYDPVGNTGKSKLVKWLCHKDMAYNVPFGTANQIKSSIIQFGRHRCFVVDIPRTTGSDETLRDIFSALEGLKNGMVQSTMYGKNSVLYLEPPHVIVFSNSLPCKKLVSRDRWAVFEVLRKGAVQQLGPYMGSRFIKKQKWDCAKCAKKNKRKRKSPS